MRHSCATLLLPPLLFALLGARFHDEDGNEYIYANSPSSFRRFSRPSSPSPEKEGLSALHRFKNCIWDLRVRLTIIFRTQSGRNHRFRNPNSPLKGRKGAVGEEFEFRVSEKATRDGFEFRVFEEAIRHAC